MPAADNKFSMELVKSYFSQLNPIAHRIAHDIDETESNYGRLWCTLNPNEQNDIINETLIRPELSLRYFDNFSSSSTSASSSSCISPTSKSASADSLTAVVLKNINDSLGRSKNDNVKMKPIVKNNNNNKPTVKKTTCINNIYAYDGRNLRTFALQKVGLKIIHDDTLGTYRDEHSMPFSFRTKSQINLHLFTDGSAGENAKKVAKKDDEICLLNASFRAKESNDTNSEIPKHDKVSIENYKKLQNELKLNLRRDSKEKMVIKSDTKGAQSNTAYERLESQTKTSVLPTKVSLKPQACRPQVKPPPAPVAASNNNEKKSIIVDCKSLEMSAINRSQNEQRLKALLNSNSASSSMNYAVYSDSYYDHGEHINLMKNFGSSGGNGSGILTASSSSAATSDDDDEKTLCEEVKLLDNDSSLRKGFDFLNNW